jgi:hypothetical protein
LSATTELDPWQTLKSHQVNCNKGCARKKVACPVGRLLLARVLANPEKAKKPRSFPFVARLYERVLCHIKDKWIEGVVMEKSTSARRMYQPENWETGELGPWRTAAETCMGYEVETDDRTRHFVNTSQVKSMRPPKISREVWGLTNDFIEEPPSSVELNDLIILRRN